jgi:L-asparaginase II
MNCVVAGRKVGDTSAMKIASGTVNKTGAEAVVSVLIPA